MKMHARVFQKDGNRFLVPGYWYPENDEGWDGMSPSSIICDGMMLGIVCKFDSHQEWLEIEAGEIAHFRYRLIGPQFAHGAIDILLIGGPLFDEERAKTVDLAEERAADADPGFVP